MKRKSSTFMRAQRPTGSQPIVPTPTTSTTNPIAEIGVIVSELSPHGVAALLAQARNIRDEERRRGSRPPLMSLSLRDFVARVQEVADGAITGTFGNKVFVAAIYRLFEERGEASGGSLPEFKDRLLAAHRAGLLVLERCEMLDRLDSMMMKSEIKHLGATYHAVVRRSR